MTAPDRGGAEIVVVGGGIYGVTTALDLARAGHDVLLLEAQEPAAGASGGPGERAVLAGGWDPRILPVARRSVERWAEREATVPGGVGLRRIGAVTAVEIPFGEVPEERVAEAQARVLVQNRLGIATEWVEGAAVRDLEPELGPQVVAALHTPGDGVADHTRATRALAAEARRAGARILTGTRASRIVTSGGRAVAVRLADGGTVGVGSAVVVLANAGTPALVDPLITDDDPLPLWPFQPQMVYLTGLRPGLLHHLVGNTARRLSVKQLPDGTVMVSGGWLVGRRHDGAPTGSLSALTANLREAVATLPALGSGTYRAVDGSRTETRSMDHLPVVDRLREVPNVYLGAGWSGHGFSLSQGFAELLAAWVGGADRPVELRPFALARFGSAAGQAS